jgi:hypothetical protein
MKAFAITGWVLAIVFLAIISGHSCYNGKNQTVYDKEFNALKDSISVRDSIISRLKGSDSVITEKIREKIKYVYVKTNAAYGLSADSSYKLFSEWTTRLAQDGVYRERYFLLDSVKPN